MNNKTQKMMNPRPVVVALFFELIAFPFFYAAFSGSDNALFFFQEFSLLEQLVIILPYFTAKGIALISLIRKKPCYDYQKVFIKEILITCALFFTVVIVSMILLQFIELPEFLGPFLVIPLFLTLILQGLGLLPMALTQDFLDRRKR